MGNRMVYVTWDMQVEFFMISKVIIYHGHSMLECYITLKQAWRYNPELRKYHFPMMAIDKDTILMQYDWELKMQKYRII